MIGISTRRIERLARALGIEAISASKVEYFRFWALEEEYPFL
jgi:hypothetical protein